MFGLKEVTKKYFKNRNAQTLGQRTLTCKGLENGPWEDPGVSGLVICEDSKTKEGGGS